MLDHINHIPWSTLKHAYGSASDIPDYMQGLLSLDPDEREWAQEHLIWGPFHQGSLFSSTPFVIKVLLQMVHDPATYEKPWILQYVSQVLVSAISFTSLPEATRADREYAEQILSEIHLQLPALLDFLENPDVFIRLSILRLLVLLRADLPHLDRVLAEKFKIEPEQSVRSTLAFCLSLIVNYDELPSILALLYDGVESPLVRIAVGFGGIVTLREDMPDSALTAFCASLEHNYAELATFEEMYAEYLSPLGAPSGQDRLLDCLSDTLSIRQKEQIIEALLEIYTKLPMHTTLRGRIGSGYYFEALVRLAFPEGKLPAEATVRDLSDSQWRILAAFQQLDLPTFQWNVSHSADYRAVLGLDFRSEVDFLDFMEGRRSAR